MGSNGEKSYSTAHTTWNCSQCAANNRLKSWSTVLLAPSQHFRNYGICGTSHCYGHKQILSIQGQRLKFFRSHSIRPSCPVIGPVIGSIIRFLHVSNNQMPRKASAKQYKLAKVRPLIAVLIQKFLNLYKFCSVHANKTHQTGYESLLPERVQNRLHMRMENVYRSWQHKNCRCRRTCIDPNHQTAIHQARQLQEKSSLIWWMDLRIRDT